MTWGVSNHCDGAMWQPAGETREEALAFARRAFAADGTKGFFVAELEPWEPGDLFSVDDIAHGWTDNYRLESNNDGPKEEPAFPKDDLSRTLDAWARKHFGKLHKWQTVGEVEEFSFGVIGETVFAKGSVAP